MQIYCPYCRSDNVIRSVYQQSGQNSQSSGGLTSSVPLAAVGAAISRSLPFPLSPAVGGLAGAVVGSLLSSLFEAPKSQPVVISCFYCQDCQHQFQ